MRLFRHFDDVPTDARGAAVALGNFDGVHRGHQVVIGEAGLQAHRLGVTLGVVTFEPHPREIFRPDDPPFRLTPLRSKVQQLTALGVDIIYSLAFDQNFAQQTAAEFVEKILIQHLGVRHVTVGYDFVFGRGKSGNVTVLRDMLAQAGIDLAVIPPVRGVALTGEEATDVISSSRIRQYLQAGEPRQAAALLGRSWEIDGRVEHGDHRGRLLQFPTANLALQDYLRPRAGVYAVKIAIPDKPDDDAHRLLDGVANIGTRPTVNGSDLRLEAHIFDFSEDLYGQHIRVQLRDWIRAEQRFDSLDGLKAQIALDAVTARHLLSGQA